MTQFVWLLVVVSVVFHRLVNVMNFSSAAEGSFPVLKRVKFLTAFKLICDCTWWHLQSFMFPRFSFHHSIKNRQTIVSTYLTGESRLYTDMEPNSPSNWTSDTVLIELSVIVCLFFQYKKLSSCNVIEYKKEKKEKTILTSCFLLQLCHIFCSLNQML